MSVVLDQCAFPAMATELSSRLDNISSSSVLTARFRLALDEAREHLLILLSRGFPFTFIHSDPNELNILVDSGSDIIIGVID